MSIMHRNYYMGEEINLRNYTSKVEEEYNSLIDCGYDKQEAFTIIQLACQCYSADHMNQNVKATMEVNPEESK